MSLSKTMTEQFGPEVLRKPLPRGEAYALMDALKTAVLDLRKRVDDLDPATKSAKPVYRVPAGRGGRT